MSEAVRWRELRVPLPADLDGAAVEALVGAFDEAGAGAAIYDKPRSLVAYLPDDSSSDPVISRLAARLLPLSIVQSVIEETNWAEAWKQFFKPRRIGRRFIVCPSWETASAGPADVVLNLDPGQAFGTGEHPTTQMMLELMEEFVRPGQTVFDIGCGSGILSVAALKMGAQTVTCTDLDLPSVRATQENLARNGVHAATVLAEGLGCLRGRADVMLSNIISATLIRLAPEAAKHVVPSGHWLASGVIAQNADAVERAMDQAGFAVVARKSEGEWVSLAARR